VAAADVAAADVAAAEAAFIEAILEALRSRASAPGGPPFGRWALTQLGERCRVPPEVKAAHKGGYRGVLAAHADVLTVFSDPPGTATWQVQLADATSAAVGSHAPHAPRQQGAPSAPPKRTFSAEAFAGAREHAAATHAAGASSAPRAAPAPHHSAAKTSSAAGDVAAAEAAYIANVVSQLHTEPSGTLMLTTIGSRWKLPDVVRAAHGGKFISVLLAHSAQLCVYERVPGTGTCSVCLAERADEHQAVQLHAQAPKAAAAAVPAPPRAYEKYKPAAAPEDDVAAAEAAYVAKVVALLRRQGTPPRMLVAQVGEAHRLPANVKAKHGGMKALLRAHADTFTLGGDVGGVQGTDFVQLTPKAAGAAVAAPMALAAPKTPPMAAAPKQHAGAGAKAPAPKPHAGGAKATAAKQHSAAGGKASAPAAHDSWPALQPRVGAPAPGALPPPRAPPPAPPPAPVLVPVPVPPPPAPPPLTQLLGGGGGAVGSVEAQERVFIESVVTLLRSPVLACFAAGAGAAPRVALSELAVWCHPPPLVLACHDSLRAVLRAHDDVLAIVPDGHTGEPFVQLVAHTNTSCLPAPGAQAAYGW
jgi:hypothetical protein